jgi:2-iminobutanoate/2-iminopropanoate deaminase
MPRTAINGDIPVSHLPFSPAIRAGDFVFVSGQASVDDAGAYVAGSFADELDRSFANVARILAAAGGSLDDVVQVRAYLGDIAFRDEFNTLYQAYFSPPMPARTTLSGGLGQLKFEIDVVAYIPGLSPPRQHP